MNGSSALGAAMTYHNEHSGPDPQVNSVNGKIGDVVLNASDIKDSDNISLQKRIVTSGNTLPSGEFVGQLHILLVDVVEATKTVRRGLYRYNGSTWDFIAGIEDTNMFEFNYTNNETTIEKTIKGA